MFDPNLYKIRLEKLVKKSNSINSIDYFQKNIWERVKLISIEQDKCIFEYTVDPKDCNSIGKLHGGFIAALIDILSTGVILVFQDKYFKAGGVSTDMSISYVNSAKAGDILLVESGVLKIGKSLSNTFTILKQKESGQVIAMGQHTKFNTDSKI